MNNSERNDLQEIIDKAIEEMARETGDSFDIDLDYLCGLMGCPECTAEPGDMPWMPDERETAVAAGTEN